MPRMKMISTTRQYRSATLPTISTIGYKCGWGRGTIKSLISKEHLHLLFKQNTNIQGMQETSGLSIFFRLSGYSDVKDWITRSPPKPEPISNSQVKWRNKETLITHLSEAHFQQHCYPADGRLGGKEAYDFQSVLLNSLHRTNTYKCRVHFGGTTRTQSCSEQAPVYGHIAVLYVETGYFPPQFSLKYLVNYPLVSAVFGWTLQVRLPPY